MTKREELQQQIESAASQAALDRLAVEVPLAHRRGELTDQELGELAALGREQRRRFALAADYCERLATAPDDQALGLIYLEVARGPLLPDAFERQIQDAYQLRLEELQAARAAAGGE
jgi:hypothetical protein